MCIFSHFARLPLPKKQNKSNKFKSNFNAYDTFIYSIYNIYNVYVEICCTLGKNNGLVIDKKKYKGKQTEMMYSKVGQKDNDGKKRDREKQRGKNIHKAVAVANIWPALAITQYNVKDIFYSYSINIELIND